MFELFIFCVKDWEQYSQVWLRVGVKYFSKYLSQVQVLFIMASTSTITQSTWKTSSTFSFKYKSSTSTLVTNNSIFHSPRWIMLLITEYHITLSCFNGNFVGSISKHIFNWKYLLLNFTEVYSPWSIGSIISIDQVTANMSLLVPMMAHFTDAYLHHLASVV